MDTFKCPTPLMDNEQETIMMSQVYFKYVYSLQIAWQEIDRVFMN